MTTNRDAAIEAALPYYEEGGCMGLSEYERREVVEAIVDAAIAAYEQELVKDGPVTSGDTPEDAYLLGYTAGKVISAADVKALREALSLFIKTRKEWVHATNRASEHVAKMKFLRACEVLAALAASKAL